MITLRVSEQTLEFAPSEKVIFTFVSAGIASNAAFTNCYCYCVFTSADTIIINIYDQFCYDYHTIILQLLISILFYRDNNKTTKQKYNSK